MLSDLVLVGAVIVSGLVSGTTGFGFGLVGMAILVAVMPVTRATSIVSILTVLTSIPVLWTVRHAVCWREMWPLLLAAMPASPLGVHLLKTLDARLLRAGILTMILASCVVTVWSPKRALVNKAFPWAPVFGVVSGIFNGALGMGGPPVVFYTLLRNWNKSQAKALLCAFFLILNAWRVILLVTGGVATADVFRQSLLLLIPALAASYLGTVIFRSLSTPAFRYAAMGLLLVLAVRLLV